MNPGEPGNCAMPLHAKNPRSLTHLRCVSADIGEFNRYTGMSWSNTTNPGN